MYRWNIAIPIRNRRKYVVTILCNGDRTNLRNGDGFTRFGFTRHAIHCEFSYCQRIVNIRVIGQHIACRL